MLDVHPPHEAAHTWTDFFIHIATIVVGLLLGIGLEQSVEWLHHHHQAEQIIESLQRESEANDEVNRQDLAGIRVFTATLTENIHGLSAAPIVDGKVHYVWLRTPVRVGWIPLADASWQMARDSAGFAQLPPEMVRNHWRVEFTLLQVNALGDSFFNERFALDAMLHQHGDEIVLTPAERDDTVRQAVKVNGVLRHLYSSTDYFSILNRLARRPEPITYDRIKKERPENSNNLPWQ